jgi:GT2 family glycosyltransferase
MTALAIVPTYLREASDATQAAKTLQTFKATCDQELVVIDDGSPNEALRGDFSSWVKEFGYEYIQTDNSGFASTVNVGLRRARKEGHDALLVNADIEFIKKGWFQAMDETPGAVVGARLLFPNGLIQHAGIYFSLIARRPEHIFRLAPGSLNQARKQRDCPVTGALQLIRYDTIKKIGLYDDAFRLGYEDLDYCLRVFQAGRKCVYQPEAVAVHHEGLFRRKSKDAATWFDQSWLYFGQKWEGKDITQWIPTLIGEDKWG